MVCNVRRCASNVSRCLELSPVRRLDHHALQTRGFVEDERDGRHQPLHELVRLIHNGSRIRKFAKGSLGLLHRLGGCVKGSPATINLHDGGASE